VINKNIFIISDVELGKKDIFDDFKDEDGLVKFLNRITNEPGKNTLIMNGDSFDFMKMPYKGIFTHHVTEEVSLWKMEQIINSYPHVFQALKKFLAKSPNKIHFNYGNHDYDLLWPAVQKLIAQTLGNEKKISYANYFETKDIHVEHGNQVDYFYKLDPEKPFITYRKQKLLNLPIGSVAVIKYFIALKEQFPFEEKVYPRHQAFESYPEFRKAKQKITHNFLLKGLLFNFIVNLHDPVANVPYINLIKHIFAHGLEIHDEAKFLKKRFKNLSKLYPGKQYYIMGHIHLAHYELNPARDYLEIVTDTWREEYRIMSDKQKVAKPKTYLHVLYEGDKLQKVNLLNFI